MKGKEVEYEFVKTFNNKTINDLSLQQKSFIKELFPDINYLDKIISWKNKEAKKADIFIKVNNLTRGISIKSGNENSMHSESISDFIVFLKKIDIPIEYIKTYQKYHFGYFNNKKYSAKELKEIMKEELYSFNKLLNKPQNIIKAVDRYIIHGIDTKYDISALITGLPNNFVWIKKENIYNLALNYNTSKYSAPHFGMLVIQPKQRDLNNTGKNKKECYRVQIKWHNLYEEIIDYYHKK